MSTLWNEVWTFTNPVQSCKESPRLFVPWTDKILLVVEIVRNSTPYFEFGGTRLMGQLGRGLLSPFSLFYSCYYANLLLSTHHRGSNMPYRGRMKTPFGCARMLCLYVCVHAQMFVYFSTSLKCIQRLQTSSVSYINDAAHRCFTYPFELLVLLGSLG